jgi:hypothetical protein
LTLGSHPGNRSELRSKRAGAQRYETASVLLFISSRAESDRLGKRTVANIRQTLHTLLAAAIRDGIRRDNPAADTGIS